jgi:tetratricopeptide (TPR) repeat protein
MKATNMRTKLAPVLSALALLGTQACAPTPAQQVARDAHVVETERTPEKLVARGEGFAQLGDLTRAEQYLAAALEAGADPKTVLPTLLRICIIGHRYRVAIGYATTYLDEHPEDAHLRFVVAELRAALDDGDGARKDLARVLETEPENAGAHFAYAKLLRDGLDDVLGADAEFRRYLALAPSGEHAEEAKGALLRLVTVPVSAPPSVPSGSVGPTNLTPRLAERGGVTRVGD